MVRLQVKVLIELEDAQAGRVDPLGPHPARQHLIGAIGSIRWLQVGRHPAWRILRSACDRRLARWSRAVRGNGQLHAGLRVNGFEWRGALASPMLPGARMSGWTRRTGHYQLTETRRNRRSAYCSEVQLSAIRVVQRMQSFVRGGWHWRLSGITRDIVAQLGELQLDALGSREGGSTDCPRGR